MIVFKLIDGSRVALNPNFVRAMYEGKDGTAISLGGEDQVEVPLPFEEVIETVKPPLYEVMPNGLKRKVSDPLAPRGSLYNPDDSGF